MALNSEHILNALKKIQEPSSKKNLIEANAIHNLIVSGSKVSFVLKLPATSGKFQAELEEACKKAILALEGVKTVEMKTEQVQAPVGNSLIPGVKNVIAVAAGKGGVGKSTLACNLAVGLVKNGFKTGLMDADVFGPSIPIMMGANRYPEVQGNKLVPLEAYGVKLMSIGFLIDENKPVIWRGPMVMGAIQQFFRDVLWGNLDYLVIDLPPGTGDTQLTLVQTVSLSGALIICTPQDVALADAKKALNMFRETHVCVLGMIENMSYFRCGKCSEVHHIFGTGGVEKVANELQVPYLGALPLLPEIPPMGDKGIPFLAGPENADTAIFMNVISRIIQQVQQRNQAPKPTLIGISGA
ncbi:MAG: Mrp/NBP35 family ATP-binding protein [Planctomycetota bacterium]